MKIIIFIPSIGFWNIFTHIFPSKLHLIYIISYCVERAKEMLLENHRNVLDISFECGFSSVSYFIKIFKKYTGTTPHKYLLNNKYGKINSDDQQ